MRVPAGLLSARIRAVCRGLFPLLFWENGGIFLGQGVHLPGEQLFFGGKYATICLYFMGLRPF